MTSTTSPLKNQLPLPVKNEIQFLRMAEFRTLQGADECYKNKEGLFDIADICSTKIQGLTSTNILNSLLVLIQLGIVKRVQASMSHGTEYVCKLVDICAKELLKLLNETQNYGFYPTERNMILMAQKLKNHNGVLPAKDCSEFLKMNALKNNITSKGDIIYATEAKGCKGYHYHVTDKGIRLVEVWHEISKKINTK